MSNVRKSSKTTVTLLVFCIGLFWLTAWCQTLDSDFITQMNLLLSSNRLLGRFHVLLLKTAFWMILIASGTDAIFSEKSALSVIGSFILPIIFSIACAVWALVSIDSYVDLRWFWLFYTLALTFCTRKSFKKLANHHDASLMKINAFIKSISRKKNCNNSKADYYVIYFLRLLLLIMWILLIIAAIVFCINHREIFIG